MKLGRQILPILDLFVFAAKGWNVLIHNKYIHVHIYTNTVLSTATKKQLLFAENHQIH